MKNLKITLIEYFMKFLMLIIVGSIIYLSWTGLEIVLDGKIVLQKGDTVFAILLSYLVAEKINGYIELIIKGKEK